jgi:hypothetical protein
MKRFLFSIIFSLIIIFSISAPLKAENFVIKEPIFANTPTPILNLFLEVENSFEEYRAKSRFVILNNQQITDYWNNLEPQKKEIIVSLKQKALKDLKLNTDLNNFSERRNLSFFKNNDNVKFLQIFPSKQVFVYDKNSKFEYIEGKLKMIYLTNNQYFPRVFNAYSYPEGKLTHICIYLSEEECFTFDRDGNFIGYKSGQIVKKMNLPTAGIIVSCNKYENLLQFEVDLDLYVKNVKYKIYKNYIKLMKSYNPSVFGKKRCAFMLLINKKGLLKDSEMFKYTDDQNFNEICRKAIEDSKPFDPFPTTFIQEEIFIILYFDYNCWGL